MEKSLVCVTSYSNKFWKIKAQGNVFIVLYGKIGSRGSVNTKEFPSEELCLKEAYKLIDSKLKKGYWESSPKRERVIRF
ncbi:molybdate metabolism regulator [Planococcus sp. PAMC 21323]|uniref:WGR domain-containing protein n=1 Tax=Planococcus sp. PAMC 21323 TaxID=1526927 RepID=UPI00056FC50D|nr:WGR domain-containing protein [Planococcus sp. PAMC 21323]AIY05548.1 molybdate metabolism regulator [Planococcus sp. PAMC 21323]